jgi:uncharacterized membrane protein YwzB
MAIIPLLLAVLVVCIVIWATRSLTAAFGVGEPISTVIMVVVVLICLLFILSRLGLNLGIT